MALASTSASAELPAPPPSLVSPAYVLRAHTAQISALAFSNTHNYLYSGDINGWIGVWDLRTFRPVYFWRAHEGGLLTLADWDEGILSHARDNQIHYFSFPEWSRDVANIRPGPAPATAVPSVQAPTPLGLEWSLPVNAMAYCKMGLLRLGSDRDGKGKGKEVGLVAVPALTKDELIDIFHLPSLDRVYRSVGADLFPIGDKTGTVMAVELFRAPLDTPHSGSLHLLAAYEDGRVVLFRSTGSEAEAVQPPTGRREASEGWVIQWEEKGHREAVMGLSLGPDLLTGWSVAADHYLCRYDLFGPSVQQVNPGPSPPPSRLQRLETTAAGRSEVHVRDDGKLVAVAGWDGETRLYSAKTGRPLAVLSYHRQSLHALALASVLPKAGTAQGDEAGGSDDDSDSDSDEEGADGAKGKVRRAWLAVGGKDERISLWEVYSEERALARQ